MSEEPLSSFMRRDKHLREGTKKVKTKDLSAALSHFIVSEHGVDKGPVAGRYWVVEGKNFDGNVVTIRHSTRENCLVDLATLNGVTVE